MYVDILRCCLPRLLHLVVRSDIDQTMVQMQKAIAVDISCVQAYDTIASIEMQRYVLMSMYTCIDVQSVSEDECIICR